MTTSPLRTYDVRTLGCQMNVHDSERMAGLLEELGLVPVGVGDAGGRDAQAEADVVVINTCAVRENADNRLYGNLGQLAPLKRARPHMRIAVTGCLAQKDRDTIVERAPWVDVVLGTHNIDALPALLERVDRSAAPQVEIVESLQAFPSDLPVRRQSAHSAWVAISVGCNNTCTFCIVPSLRGRERDRTPDAIVAEATALVAQGVREITLLGQNVNAYGVEFGDRNAFADLLRRVGSLAGLQRLRFTSPHPRDFTQPVIDAMAQTPAVMPHLHLPLQSGSDGVLRRMRRSYRAERYLAIVADIRAAIPDAAITTDIIVGFPGETDDDFAATLDVVRQARFSGAFTFQYSPRPGTPAADFDDQVPADVVARRYPQLVALVDEIAWAENRALVGSAIDVMIADVSGRKDGATHRVTGRARDNRLVHLAAPLDHGLRPGDVVATVVTRAAPHHLLADAGYTVLDRWEPADSACAPASASVGPVVLGLPSVR